MGKDPAFLFYPNDYIGGTMGMTFEEKGAYIELLMLQFNRGHMTKHMIGQTVGQIWDKISDKFAKDDQDLFYNERLELEQNKRKSYTESRRNNISGKNQHSKVGHTTKHMTPHMENENIDRDETVVNDCKSSVCKDIIDDLNQILITTYKHTSKKTQSLIKARIAEGFTLDDFKLVHRKKALEWHNDEKMVKFLRPETLYSNKFEGYLNQKESQGSNLTDTQKRNVASFHRLKERIKK